MMFLWIPFLLLIPLVVVMMTRSSGAAGCCGMAQHSPMAPQPPASSTSTQDALEIARLRLARGEVTPEQFAEIRRALQG